MYCLLYRFAGNIASLQYHKSAQSDEGIAWMNFVLNVEPAFGLLCKSRFPICGSAMSLGSCIFIHASSFFWCSTPLDFSANHTLRYVDSSISLYLSSADSPLPWAIVYSYSFTYLFFFNCFRAIPTRNAGRHVSFQAFTMLETTCWLGYSNDFVTIWWDDWWIFAS